MIARIGWMLAMAVSIAAGSVASAPPDAAELNRRALEAVEAGEYDRAISLLREARTLEPENDTLRVNLARVEARLGARLYREGKLEPARLRFLEAIELQPDSAEHPAQLGAVLFSMNRLEEARRCLLDAIRLDRSLAPAHESLGHVYYREGRLREALASWETALELEPEGEALRRRVERLRREVAVEDRFLASDGSLFEIRYDGELDPRIVDGIRDHLMRAYREVGAVLGHYPQDRVQVVLYTRPGFSQVTEGSRWVAGIFDGKIRLPIDAADSNPESLGDTVMHEYTHFVIHALAPKCPAWLHEGIAQWKEGRSAAGVKESLRKALERGKLVPIFDLEESFARTEDPDAARIRYAQALSFSAFLVDRFGDYTLADLVRSVGKTGSVEKGILEVYRTSPASLAEEWLESLR